MDLKDIIVGTVVVGGFGGVLYYFIDRSQKKRKNELKVCFDFVVDNCKFVNI